MINPTVSICMNESELAERFELAFNQIHYILKRKLLNPEEYIDVFMKLLTVSSRKHRMIQRFFYDWRQFAKLRNAIVTENGSSLESQLGIVTSSDLIEIDLLHTGEFR